MVLPLGEFSMLNHQTSYKCSKTLIMVIDYDLIKVVGFSVGIIGEGYRGTGVGGLR